MLGNATKGWVLDMVGDQAEYEQRLKAVETKASKNTEDIASNKEDIETNAANIETNTEAISTINSDLSEEGLVSTNISVSTLKQGYWDGNDGQFYTNSTYVGTDYISCSAGDSIMTYNQYGLNAIFFDSSNNVVAVNVNVAPTNATKFAYNFYNNGSSLTPSQVGDVMFYIGARGVNHEIASLNDSISDINSELSTLIKTKVITVTGDQYNGATISNTDLPSDIIPLYCYSTEGYICVLTYLSDRSCWRVQIGASTEFPSFPGQHALDITVVYTTK